MSYAHAIRPFPLHIAQGRLTPGTVHKLQRLDPLALANLDFFHLVILDAARLSSTLSLGSIAELDEDLPQAVDVKRSRLPGYCSHELFFDIRTVMQAPSWVSNGTVRRVIRSLQDRYGDPDVGS